MRDLPIELFDKTNPQAAATYPNKYGLLSQVRSTVGGRLQRPGVRSLDPYGDSFLMVIQHELAVVDKVFDWSPTAHRYVSDSLGSDSNDGLTESTPWKTLDKVRSELDAGNITSGTYVHFRKGDTWTDNTANDTSQNGACALQCSVDQIAFVGDWGTGSLPLFNRFTLSYSSGWTLVSVSTYSRSESNAIACVRRSDDRLVPLYEASDSSDVSTQIAETNGSWFWDSVTSTLYVDFGGTDPNTLNLEAAISQDAAGIVLRSDQSFVKDMRFDGFGLDNSSSNNQQSGVRLSPNTNDRVAAIGVGCYYGSAHVLAQNSFTQTNGGGTGYFKDCTAGLSRYNSSGNTVYNSYAQDGNQNTYINNCVAWGTLPSHEWAKQEGGKWCRGASFFCHTGGAGAKTGRIIVYKMSAPDVAWGCASAPYFNDLPTVSDTAAWSDCKGHAVLCSVENSRGGEMYATLCPNDSVTWGAKIVRKAAASENVRAMTNSVDAGLIVNSRIDYTFGSGLNNTWALINDSVNPYAAAQFRFCDIVLRPTNATHDVRLIYDGSSAGVNMTIDNCLIAVIGTYDLNQLGTGSPPYNYCGFYGATIPGVATNSVTVTDVTETDDSHVPASGDALFGAAGATPFPRLDRLETARPVAVSIGDIG